MLRCLAIPLLLLGCAVDAGRQTAAVIYGEDDRMEVPDHPNRALADIARRSVGVVVDRRLVSDPANPGAVALGTFVEGVVGAPLCEGEPFADQPVLASCSGVLLNPDLFLTAAHCIPTQEFCENRSIVMGWHLGEEGAAPALTPGHVYRCVLLEAVSYIRDYAIVRLERRVSEGFDGAPFRPGSEGPLRAGARVSVIGSPSGVWMKIDDQGEVIRQEPVESFAFLADVFEGQSGAPVLDEEERVVGIVSLGSDADYDVRRGCARAQVASAERSDGITAAYVYRAVHDLCRSGLGPARLCDGTTWCPECKGAGCSTTGSAEGLPLLAALALLARRRRLRE